MRTPSSTRAVKRGQPTGSAISMRMASATDAADSDRHPERPPERDPEHRRRLTPHPEVAERIAAVRRDVHLEHHVLEPERLRQRRPRDAASFGRMSRPLASSDSPSSLPEQSIPWLSTPRRLACWMVGPPGNVVPTVASGTRSPTWKFFAPQTTCSRSPTGVHLGDGQLLGVRVRRGGGDARHHHPGERLGRPVHPLDLQARPRQTAGELVRTRQRRDEVGQPLGGDLHG